MTSALGDLQEAIRHEAFAFVSGARLRELLGPQPSDWDAFVSSWNFLELDTHLPDGHRYRRRRHATLSADAGARDFRIEPHQPHYQGLEYNRLVGGIERWFEPITPDIVAGESFRQVLRFCLALYAPMRPEAHWHIECHQFRIEARPEAAGMPTPEGVHRDGGDYVLVMLVGRVNIQSGTTTVHDLEGKLLGSFTLAAPCDAALVDDTRVKHGVTPVLPLDTSQPAHRDVLVVTLRRRPP